jgi:hypothetical protein
MRSLIWILAAVIAVGLVATVAAGAYRAGERHADDDVKVVQVESPDGGEANQGVEVVLIEDGAGRRWRFLPFGLVFPVLLIILFVILMRGAFGRWRGGPWLWGDAGAEEWHRRQHQISEESGTHGETSGGQ